ncbi:hypothetical protein H6501_02710 [Candidatus Woesearchaeota archaeon]|nr:hypothetical protein [Nanoarchaeota archaeon]MCB9370482.1 hypothetical protein [Candidatus Woesearchaeota archaeon]USN43560.1 MAG: hypothetical protein H6500_04155 [Candidatus Woesearchaeota archaeon]
MSNLEDRLGGYGPSSRPTIPSDEEMGELNEAYSRSQARPIRGLERGGESLVDRKDNYRTQKFLGGRVTIIHPKSESVLGRLFNVPFWWTVGTVGTAGYLVKEAFGATASLGLRVVAYGSLAAAVGLVGAGLLYPDSKYGLFLDSAKEQVREIGQDPKRLKESLSETKDAVTGAVKKGVKIVEGKVGDVKDKTKEVVSDFMSSSHAKYCRDAKLAYDGQDPRTKRPFEISWVEDATRSCAFFPYHYDIKEEHVIILLDGKEKSYPLVNVLENQMVALTYDPSLPSSEVMNSQFLTGVFPLVKALGDEGKGYLQKLETARGDVFKGVSTKYSQWEQEQTK